MSNFSNIIRYPGIEPWNGDITCPTLVINSEEYTLSSDYPILQKIAKTAPTPPVYSISGSTHPSFSGEHPCCAYSLNKRMC